MDHDQVGYLKGMISRFSSLSGHYDELIRYMVRLARLMGTSYVVEATHCGIIMHVDARCDAEEVSAEFERMLMHRMWRERSGLLVAH